MMVLILLTPSIVKLEHHHEHFFCHATTEKHLHNYHEICPICNFEFSIVLFSKAIISFTKLELVAIYINRYTGGHFTNRPQYSFLLRAPPSFTNDI